MKTYVSKLFLLGAPYLFLLTGCSQNDKNQPNIIWIIAEDMSPHFGYNGDSMIRTPHVDRLAAEGLQFSQAYVTAPVCSPSRSALITGMYQTSIGAHNHRSSRGIIKIILPEGIKTIPEYFRQEGYYVTNVSYRNQKWDMEGKEDYNFDYDSGDLYEGTDWSGRNEGQPFFTQIQLQGGKNRKAIVPDMVDPDKVSVPVHYPDDPVIRKDWAEYLNSVQYVDMQVGEIMNRLKEEELLENSIIFFMTDHGISHARGKQFCYDEGTHIPMIIWGPDYVGKGKRTDLVAHIDWAATSMGLAGIPVPDYMESRDLLAEDYTPRSYLISARDRCDETVDHIRSVRTDSFLYIRNYIYHRPLLQPNAYKDHKAIIKRIRELHREGELSELQERLLFGKERDPEELYDLTEDENQYYNLASREDMQPKLKEMRKILHEWEKSSGDMGQVPEREEQYDSEMAVILQKHREKGNTKRIEVLLENIDTMKKWRAEGK